MITCLSRREPDFKNVLRLSRWQDELFDWRHFGVVVDQLSIDALSVWPEEVYERLSLINLNDLDLSRGSHDLGLVDVHAHHVLDRLTDGYVRVKHRMQHQWVGRRVQGDRQKVEVLLVDWDVNGFVKQTFDLRDDKYNELYFFAGLYEERPLQVLAWQDHVELGRARQDFVNLQDHRLGLVAELDLLLLSA